MKKFIIFFCLFLSASIAFGQERCHIVTDRFHYIAGERLFCSVTALSESGSGISEQSGVAYAALYSAEGLAASSRIELIDGRGGGEMTLPKTLPTGNYLLAAWTKASGLCDRIRVISVYNPATTARTGDVVIEEEYAPAQAEARKHSSAEISLDENAHLSVALVRDCGLPQYEALPGGRIAAAGLDEPEGEIISVRISGNENYEGLEAFLAVPGSNQLYPAPIEKNGTVRFHTENIHGNQDVAFVIGKNDEVGKYTLSLVQPFPEAIGLEIPAMRLSLSMKPLIAELGNSVVETLDIVFPERKPSSLYADKSTSFSYILDDYTRFPTMRETITEFVSDIRARRDNGEVDLRVRYIEDMNGYSRYDKKRSLIMLDGVPIFKQQLIYEYDPTLVERIDIYRGIYVMGNNYFRGMANFVTFEKTLPAFSFGDDVKILEIDGVSPVHAYSGGHETLYWNPLVELETGQKLEISLPETAEGRYILTVEGFTDSGKAVCEKFLLSK